MITRAEAVALGLSRSDIEGYLDRGTWERVHRNVYRLGGSPTNPRQNLRAACLAAGSDVVASHISAAWLWDLVERAPERPEITVPTTWRPELTGVKIHRSRDLDLSRTIIRSGIPTTDPLRTLVDLGAVMTPPELSDIIDRSLARRLVTLQGVVAEIDRLSRRGRPGLKHVRAIVQSRGLSGAPYPSVLESRMLRLLRQYRLPAPVIELTVGPEGQYRLDFAYPDIKLAIEVDGYVWHFTPEHQRRDNLRRNWLHANGWHTLTFTWTDVTQRPQRVAADIRAALASLGAK